MALDYTVIGQRIKQARLAKNLTQLCGLLDVTEVYVLNGAASNSKNYLNKEFAELFKSCSPDKQKLIYNVAKAIVESDLED